MPRCTLTQFCMRVHLQEIDLDMLDKVGSAKGVEEMRIQLKQQVSVHWQAMLL